MEINIEHVKHILSAFLESDKMYVSVLPDLVDNYPVKNDGDHDFIFHYLMLIEQGFIASAATCEKYNPKVLGYSGLERMSDGYAIGLIDTHVRITKEGYEFAKALSKPSIYDRMQELSSEPIGVMVDIGKELMAGYLKQKFGIAS
ncbi:hypothetical protein [Aeromonas salmonicida]